MKGKKMLLVKPNAYHRIEAYRDEPIPQNQLPEFLKTLAANCHYYETAYVVTIERVVNLQDHHDKVYGKSDEDLNY